MRSIGTYHGLPIEDLQSLVEQQIPVPDIADDELLVRVQAVSVNPADYRVRKRKADDGQFQVLGWDVAGEVVKVGADVKSFTVGDAVYYAGDLNRPGGNSEFHAVDAALVGHRPQALSAAESAAIPLTALTAWESLFEGLGITLGDDSAGRTLLIVGGAGGVGSMAIQLARQVPGLTVVATASRKESQDWCKKLGAHLVIDHFSDMRAQLAAANYKAPDYVLLLNDPDSHYPAIADLLIPQGAICCVVPFDQPVDLNPLMRKSARFVWEFMFTRAMFNTADKYKQGEILNRVAVLIDQGCIASTATETFGGINADNLRKAHALLESGRTIGKVVLANF